MCCSHSRSTREMRVLWRVRHLKELSIDNKRMFCAHGYSLSLARTCTTGGGGVGCGEAAFTAALSARLAAMDPT